jgi:hypothetical protein
LARVCFEVDEVEMWVGPNDSGGAGDLHDLGDVFGLDPDLDRTCFALPLG